MTRTTTTRTRGGALARGRERAVVVDARARVVRRAGRALSVERIVSIVRNAATLARATIYGGNARAKHEITLRFW